MLLALTLAALPVAKVQVAASAALAGQEPVPNYAATMTGPIEGDATSAPWLWAKRRRLPIRVGVIPKEGMMTAERLAIVRAACERWATAAKGTELGLRFTYVPYKNPGDAEIVFEYRTMTTAGTLRGFTTEFGGYAVIDLAVEDGKAKALPAAEILRVATHEVGHALGIWGHSPDAADIMSVSTSPSIGATTMSATAPISLADVNTLRLAYRHTPLP